MQSTAELSLEQAPPFVIPLRFFLTAPLFGMGAGLLLLILGPDALSNRWVPATMALTHMLTLGFISMVMCGAVLQVLPVLGGVPVPGVLSVGPAVHLLLSLGTVSLVAGFLWGWVLAFDVAVIGLGGGFILFLGAVGLGLWRAGPSNPMVRALWAVLLALLVTMLLGMYLVWVISGYGSSPHLLRFVDLHLSWGLLGWAGLLILAMGFQVVPLFQMTPEYPARVRRGVIPLVFLLLLAWSVASATVGGGPWLLGVQVLLMSGFVGFAVQTLYLQGRRRRKVPDLLVAFWRGSAISMLATAILWLTGLFQPQNGAWSWYPLLLGFGLLVGVILTVINGMLYKIVPFLAWFHLQHRQIASPSSARGSIPHMKELLPDTLARRQYHLHLGVLVLGVAAIFFPEWLARPLGGLVLLSFGLLGYNLLRAALGYRKAERRLSATEAGRPE